ncbi:Secreted protein [Plantibacter sp. RU18]
MDENTWMDEMVENRRPASWWMLLTIGLASVVAMGVLAFLPSTVHERVVGGDHPGYATVCSSVVVAGWPRDIGDVDDRLAARGILSTDTSEPPYDICANRRSLSAAGMAVFAVPSSVLLFLAAGSALPAARLRLRRER